MLTHDDLRAYAAVPREPARATYRGRDVHHQPAAVGRRHPARPGDGPPRRGARPAEHHARSSTAMEAAQDERTPEFVEGLAEPGFLRPLPGRRGSASTTHISVLDGDGRACSVTCTNGEGSGVVVPGTGIHVNNIMGEEDLSPLGFHTAPPGRRMPSMMAPTVVLGDGRGRARPRQRGLQPHPLGDPADDRRRGRSRHERPGRGARAAGALRERDRLRRARRPARASCATPAATVAPFRDLNLFFGGVQAVERDPATGALSGAGDPRRGGAAVAP